jgi:hypothetical protein
MRCVIERQAYRGAVRDACLNTVMATPEPSSHAMERSQTVMSEPPSGVDKIHDRMLVSA